MNIPLSIHSYFSDMLFPRRCFGCGKYDAYLCNACAVALEESELICPACGEPSFTGERHITCGAARYTLDGLMHVWRYDGVARAAVRGVKYERLGDAMPELMVRVWNAFEMDWLRYERFVSFAQAADAFAYVPMRVLAEDKRGFNQAQLIAERLAEHFEKPTLDIFRKTRKIASQTNFDNPLLRGQNVRHAYALKSAAPRKLVIVDDVWTTGATMKECARAARRGGARSIWGFTLTGAL